MEKTYTVVCNWKMYFSYNQTHTWIETHKKDLISLANQSAQTIVLCPSSENIMQIQQAFEETHVFWGAQDCSNKNSGAYTGQYSAQSLKELGCTYCIIGHSERRIYQHETSELIAEKLEQLLNSTIIPIVCVGETAHEHNQKATNITLKNQLKPLLDKKKNNKSPWIIAYEPVWAIGTGNIPTPAEIEKAFTQIILLSTEANISPLPQLLYGGSVSSETINNLKQVNGCDGFLIGGASTDFQELKKIVLLL